MPLTVACVGQDGRAASTVQRRTTYSSAGRPCHASSMPSGVLRMSKGTLVATDGAGANKQIGKVVKAAADADPIVRVRLSQ